MFIFSNLISLNNKLVVYSFLGNSGINDTANNAGFSVSSQPSVASIVGTVVGGLLSLLGVIFLGLTIYGGVMWMTAEGKEERVEKAKNIIVNSLIGLVIIIAAYAISFFVLTALTKS
jgi:phosphate/sulfate permease